VTSYSLFYFIFLQIFSLASLKHGKMDISLKKIPDKTLSIKNYLYYGSEASKSGAFI